MWIPLWKWHAYCTTHNLIFLLKSAESQDFPGGPAAKISCSQGSGLGQGTKIPHAAAESSHAPTKDPECHMKL